MKNPNTKHGQAKVSPEQRNPAAGQDPSLSKPAEEASEEATIRRVQNGESDLFYGLIRPYEQRMYHTAFAILRNEADAEDVAQDAVLKAFQHITQFRGEAKFSTWLIQITINEARMRKRKEHSHIYEAIT